MVGNAPNPHTAPLTPPLNLILPKHTLVPPSSFTQDTRMRPDPKPANDSLVTLKMARRVVCSNPLVTFFILFSHFSFSNWHCINNVVNFF
jgi:hypothetical protein